MMRRRKRACGVILRITLACLAMLASACGSSVNAQFMTPNATEMMVQAATGIAVVATSNALTASVTVVPAETATATATVTAIATATPIPATVITMPAETATVTAIATATPIPATVIAMPAETATVTAIATAMPMPISATVIVMPTETATATATATATPIPATVTATATATPTASSFIDYTVETGDNLLSIALQYHVSLATLMVQNEINDAARINAGQVLKIPNIPASSAENVFWTVYVVQPGENLSEIAQQNDVAVDDLVTVNKIADPAAIQVGQRLILPLAGPGAIAARPSAPDQKAAVASSSRSAVAAPAQKAAPAAAQPPPPPPIQAANVTGAEAMRASLLAAYNQARASYGIAPLNLSPALQQSAQFHAQDCVQRGYGSHVGSDGATTHQRIARAGFVGRITGENWAWARTPAGAFDMWFNQESNSGPHRANILSVRYTNVGFGIAAGNGGYYFIADFGAP
jgi:uncharacterized protein YkwD